MPATPVLAAQPRDATARTGAGEIACVASSVTRLEPGLYAIEIVPGGPSPAEGEDPGSAAVWLAQASSGAGIIDVLSVEASGDQWLVGPGKVAAVRSPPGGGMLIATSFGSPDRPPTAPRIIARPLEQVEALGMADARLAPPVAAATPPIIEGTGPATIEAAGPATRDIRIEVMVHLEGTGDRVFPGSAWAGRPGDQRRVEGFCIRPMQELQPDEIEYKALHPGGVETPWVRGPQFCGTRGRSMPITGLAIRIAPHVQDQFSVVYQAAFFRSGVSEPRRNGAPCLPRIAGDAVAAINIRVMQGRGI